MPLNYRMRIDYRLFFSVLLVLGACNSNEPVRPDDIIPEDKMAVIMADVHIVDAEMFNVQQQPDSLYKYGMGYYVATFKKFHTDTVQFKKSFTWYTKHPVQLDAIYDDVVKIVQKKSDSINKIPVPGDTSTKSKALKPAPVQ